MLQNMPRIMMIMIIIIIIIIMILIIIIIIMILIIIIIIIIMILIMISIIRAITFHNEAVSFGQFLAVVEILILYYHQLFAFKCFC